MVWVFPYYLPHAVMEYLSPTLLDALIPRSLDPSLNQETVTLLHNLFTQIHIERRKARKMGWRGFLPSRSHHPCWTMRVGNSDWIYGISYVGERFDETSLAGSFWLMAFPNAKELKDLLPKGLRDIVKKDDFYERVREISSNESEFRPFTIAMLTLCARRDKQGMSLILEAPMRRTDADARKIRPLRVAMPLFSALSRSLEAILGAKSKIVFNKEESGNAIVDVVFGLSPVDEEDVGKTYQVEELPLAYKPDEVDQSNKPVIHIVCGFLGSGKTTFIQGWLNFLHTRERFTGVLQNEFGEIDLDSRIIGKETHVEGLNEGCICCTLADSLRPGILRLVQSTPAEQILLETTGLANPNNVLGSIDELDDLVVQGLVVTIVDSKQMSEHPEYWNEDLRLAQIRRADILVCTKVDLVDKESLSKVIERLKEINHSALLMKALGGFTNFAALDEYFNTWLDKKYGLNSRNRSPEVNSYLLTTFGGRLKKVTGNKFFETYTITLKEKIELPELENLIKSAGEHILRAKGIVKLKDKGDVLVQFTDGLLNIESFSDAGTEMQFDGWLTIIGTGLRQLENASPIRREICL